MRTLTWGFPGSVQAETNLVEYVMVKESTPLELVVHAQTAPDVDTTINVKKNGTTILRTPVNLFAGARTRRTSLFADKTFKDGTVITCSVDSGGSGVAGLTVELHIEDD